MGRRRPFPAGSPVQHWFGRAHRRQEVQRWSLLRANGEGQSMHRGAQGERYVWGFISSFALTRFISVLRRWRRLHIYRRSKRFFRPARSSYAYLFLGEFKKKKRQPRRDRYKFLFFFISCVNNQQNVSPCLLFFGDCLKPASAI